MAPTRGSLALVGLLLAAVPALAGQPDSTGPGTDTCGGTAPDSTSCNTGIHVRVPFTGVSHGVPLPRPGYTGTIESRITWLPGAADAAGVGARLFRCSFDQGTLLGCAAAGEPPPQPWPLLSHDCRSDALGTTLEGGTGAWACFVSHG